MFHYKESIAFASIPVLSMAELSAAAVQRCQEGWRITAFFAMPSASGPEAICILADAASGMLDALRAQVGS